MSTLAKIRHRLGSPEPARHRARTQTGAAASGAAETSSASRRLGQPSSAGVCLDGSPSGSNYGEDRPNVQGTPGERPPAALEAAP